MFGIIGSGFGIYGYTPSVIETEGGVYLLNKSKKLCATRAETKKIFDKISWVKTLDELYEKTTGIIFALPPMQQYHETNELISNGMYKLQKLVLEKPLAANPILAQNMLTNLKENAVVFRIAYICSYLAWYDLLQQALNKEGQEISISIEWKFHAYYLLHEQDIWKKYHSLGGGCLRFYGIHLISILALLDFDVIGESTLYFLEEDVPIRWVSHFSNNYGAKIAVDLDINYTESIFSIKNSTKSIYENDNIFPENDSKYVDTRSIYLEKLLHSFNKSTQEFYQWYDKTNLLWKNIEDNIVKIKMENFL